MDYSSDYNNLTAAELDGEENKMENELVTQENKVKVITTLKDLLVAFMEAKDRIKVLDEAYEKETEPIKQAKLALQAEIIQTFKERNEFSTKIEGITASLAVRKTAKIADEKALVQALKEAGIDKDYVQERVNTLFIDSVLPDQAKAEKMFPGIVIQETEYLSTRSNDKKDARKITTKEFVKLNK